jgi:hypothetical protein
MRSYFADTKCGDSRHNTSRPGTAEHLGPEAGSTLAGYTAPHRRVAAVVGEAKLASLERRKGGAYKQLGKRNSLGHAGPGGSVEKPRNSLLARPPSFRASEAKQLTWGRIPNVRTGRRAFPIFLFFCAVPPSPLSPRPASSPHNLRAGRGYAVWGYSPECVEGEFREVRVGTFCTSKGA